MILYYVHHVHIHNRHVHISHHVCVYISNASTAHTHTNDNCIQSNVTECLCAVIVVVYFFARLLFIVPFIQCKCSQQNACTHTQTHTHTALRCQCIHMANYKHSMPVCGRVYIYTHVYRYVHTHTHSHRNSGIFEQFDATTTNTNHDSFSQQTERIEI